MSTTYTVRIQIRHGSLVVSENDYEYESEHDATEAALACCDVAEQSDGVKEINGEAVRP